MPTSLIGIGSGGFNLSYVHNTHFTDQTVQSPMWYSPVICLAKAEPGSRPQGLHLSAMQEVSARNPRLAVAWEAGMHEVDVFEATFSCRVTERRLQSHQQLMQARRDALAARLNGAFPS